MIRQKIQDPNGIHLDIIETVEKKAVRDGMKRPMGLLNLYKRIPSSCLAIPARPPFAGSALHPVPARKTTLFSHSADPLQRADQPVDQ